MHHVVHAILKTSHGTYLLQLRDKKPGVLHPGVVGFFGGSAEGIETAEECLIRELYEELTLQTGPEDMQLLWKTTHLTAKEHGTLWSIYLVCNVDASCLTLLEGAALLELRFEEILDHPLVPDEAKIGLQEHEESIRIGF